MQLFSFVLLLHRHRHHFVWHIHACTLTLQKYRVSNWKIACFLSSFCSHVILLSQAPLAFLIVIPSPWRITTQQRGGGLNNKIQYPLTGPSLKHIHLHLHMYVCMSVCVYVFLFKIDSQYFRVRLAKIHPSNIDSTVFGDSKFVRNCF